MRQPLSLLFVALIALAAPGPHAPAQGKEAIDDAIARGAHWLIRTQSRDGSWRGPQFEHYRGFTALCAYTLIKCGYPKEHPAVRAAFDWLERQELHRTYDLGCALMAYEAYGDDRPMPIVKEYAKKLVQSCGNGSRDRGGRWGYPGNHDEQDMTWTDLSNTQYAVLGLRAARRCGVKAGTKRFWTRVANDLLEDQESYGGFGYRQGQKANGSMTVAGITTLVVCRDALNDLNGGRAIMGRLRAGVNRGFMWLDKHWDLQKIAGAWHYYYMYGMERVCAFTDKGRVGKHEWHAVGSKALVGAQHADGHWRHSESDTCFALLFLRRGSRASGLGPRSVAAQKAAKDAPFSIGMNGEHPLIAWIRNIGVLRSRLDGGDGIVAMRWRVNGEVVATITAPDEGALMGPSCNLQYPFERNGTFSIQAEVELRPKDGGKTKVYGSNVLTHIVDAIEEEWHLEALRDGSRQILEEEDVIATASSEAWGWSKARFAADQRQASSWWCKQGDVRPWIKLSLSHGVRAGFIKVVQAHQHGGPLRARARPKDIEVRINNSRKAIPVRLVDDPLRKQYIRVPKTSIRSIRIDIKSTYRGSRANESSVCGFKEIELYSDPHPKDLESLPDRLRYLIPIARQGGAEWRYTTEPPSVMWHRTTFKDKAWAKGKTGFGTKGGPTLPKLTDWKTPDIWMRKEFRLVPGDSRQLKFEVCHDDDVVIYVNGVLAAQSKGWSQNDYKTLELSPEAQAALISGRNVLAVHCSNPKGEGYIDVGLLQATK